MATKLGRPKPGIENRRSITNQEEKATGLSRSNILVSSLLDGSLLFWRRVGFQTRQHAVRPETVGALEKFWAQLDREEQEVQARKPAAKPTCKAAKKPTATPKVYEFFNQIEAEIDRLDDNGKLAGEPDLNALRECMHNISTVCMAAILWANAMEETK
jgi:hypothetical protein